ncbi:fungal trichothecene efflux pump [Fusarium oxysporum]|nr:fungal trichothecene efflux pump [Fusarium oxysporum]
MSNLSHIGVDGYIGKEREFETFGPEDSGDGSGSPQPTVNAEEIIMADGTVEYVDKNAFGDELDRMPNGYYRSPQFIGTLAAQCLASTCAYLGWVLPSNTLALINADIGPSAQIAWVATIWTMGSSIGFLIIGRLSDLYGRKWMVMSTTLLGLIGCIIGGTAKSLVVARTMIENIHEGWRWSYYLGIILSVITLALYQFLYHPPTFSQLHVGKTRIQQTKELDWIGMSLFTIGCVLFLVGLSWGGTTYPWKSAEVLCTLVTGIMTLAGFFVYEAYFCSVKPLIPSSVFKNTGFVAVVTCATVASMVYYSLTVLWPTIISALYTTDSIKVGWQSCVIGGGVVLGQAMSGLAFAYVPRLKIQCICAAALVMTFITSMCSLSPDRWANTIAFGLIACTAVGYIENVAVTCVTLLWEPQDIGLASGILGSIRALGGAIAQALYVSILSNELTRKMPEYVTPAATKLGLPTKSLPSLFEAINKGDYSDVPGINKAIIESVGDAVVKAYTNSLHYVFYATVPFSCIMLVAACLVPDAKKFLTYNVARRLQDKSFRKSSTEANEVAVQAMNECHPDEAKVASHV